MSLRFAYRDRILRALIIHLTRINLMWVAAIKNMTFKYPILKECHCIINSSRINIFRQKKQYNGFFKSCIYRRSCSIIDDVRIYLRQHGVEFTVHNLSAVTKADSKIIVNSYINHVYVVGIIYRHYSLDRKWI